MADQMMRISAWTTPDAWEPFMPRDSLLPPTFADVPEPWRTAYIAQSALIVRSHRHLLRTELIAAGPDAEADAKALYEAPFCVLSHGTEPDPILNYGNRVALQLWETTIPSLTATPSRLTAEPMAREARDKIMGQVTRDGYVTGYSGVRISATGRRFRIANVTIFNLSGAEGAFAGQAAVFDRWSDTVDAATSA